MYWRANLPVVFPSDRSDSEKRWRGPNFGPCRTRSVIAIHHAHWCNAPRVRSSWLASNCSLECPARSGGCPYRYSCHGMDYRKQGAAVRNPDLFEFGRIRTAPGTGRRAEHLLPDRGLSERRESSRQAHIMSNLNRTWRGRGSPDAQRFNSRNRSCVRVLRIRRITLITKYPTGSVDPRFHRHPDDYLCLFYRSPGRESALR